MSPTFVRRLTFGVPFWFGLVLSGCGGGGGGSTPASPTAPTTPAAPTVTSLAVTGTGCAAGISSATPIRTLCTAKDVRKGDTLQLRATATLSDTTTQNVSSLAQWNSTNPNVATVTASGLVTIVAAGESDVAATYQGRTAGHTVRTTLKVPYRGTTSQGLPILIEVAPSQPSALSAGSRVLGYRATIRYRFDDGTESEGTQTSTFETHVNADGSFRRNSAFPFEGDFFEGVIRDDGTCSGRFRQTFPPIFGKTGTVTLTYDTRLSTTWPEAVAGQGAALPPDR